MSDQDEREEYQRAVRLRAENVGLVDEFRAWLTAAGFRPRTVRGHTARAAQFVNDFLADAENLPAHEGVPRVHHYFEAWVPFQIPWRSESALQQAASSLKKFYVFLESREQVTSSDVETLRSTLASGLPKWTATLREDLDADTCIDLEEQDLLSILWAIDESEGASPEPEAETQPEDERRCLLQDAPFADLVQTNPELAKLRRDYAKRTPQERREAASELYDAACSNAIWNQVGRAFGRVASEPLWFDEIATLAIDPEYAPALLAVGSLEYQCGHVDEALALFSQLVSLPKETEDLAIIIDKAGDFLTDRDDYKHALQLYEAAVAANPEEVIYHTGIGYCAGKTGQWARAVEHSQRAVDLAPEKGDSWTDLGYSLIEMGRYDEAETALRHALTLPIKNPDLARGNLAYLAELRSE